MSKCKGYYVFLLMFFVLGMSRGNANAELPITFNNILGVSTNIEGNYVSSRDYPDSGNGNGSETDPDPITGEWINHEIGYVNVIKTFMDPNSPGGKNILVGTNEGFAVFDGEEWVTITAEHGIAANLITSIAIDYNGGIIWLGTTNGLTRIDEDGLTNYDAFNSGLADNIIMSMAIGRDGSLWIGTSWGVSKFEGTNWTTYNMANSGLVNDIVRSITIGRDGSLWFGTNGGVSRFDGANWTTYNMANSGLVYDDVESIAIDLDKNVWFGTSSGISRFDGSNWTTYNMQNGGPAHAIGSIAIGQDGSVWFGTYGGGVYRFNNGEWLTYTETDGLMGHIVTSIAMDQSDGSLWFGTNNGVSHYIYGQYGPPDPDPDPVVGEWINHEIGSGVRIVRTFMGQEISQVVAGTANYGLFIFDGTNWENITVRDGLAGDFVTSIAIDYDSATWIGTSTGVTRIDDEGFTNYNTTNSGLVHDHVRSIAICQDGGVWLGTLEGISRFDGTDWMTYDTANSGLAHNFVTSIEICWDGNFWFGTYGGGVSVFNGATWNTYTTDHGLANNYVKSITIEVDNNSIWLATAGGGASRFDGTNWTTYNMENSGIAHNMLNDVAVNYDGSVWFATAGNGVSVYSSEGWITYNTTNSGIENDAVSSIAVDYDGSLWFGTNIGLSHYIYGGGDGPPPDPDPDPDPTSPFMVVEETGVPKAVIVSDATINGQPLEPGDWIGIFDGDLHNVVGAGSFDGTYPVTITVWIEYEFPLEEGGGILPGADPANSMSFQIWKISSETYIEDITAAYEEGEGLFGEPLTVVSLSLEEAPSDEVTQYINLAPWKANMISFNVTAEDMNVANLLSGVPNLIIAHDDDGKAYIPAHEVNTTGELNNKKGYWLFHTGAEHYTLSVTGLPVQPDTISYAFTNTRMYLIGNPYQQTVPVAVTMDAIVENLMIVQNDRGRFWIPKYGVNTLGNLEPGKGYQLYAYEACSFTWPEEPTFQPLAAKTATPELAPTHFEFQETGLPYAVILDVSGIELSTGDEIGLFDGELCVGAVVFEGGSEYVPIAAWKGSANPPLPGYTVGNELSVMVWKLGENQEYTLESDIIEISEVMSVLSVDAPTSVETTSGGPKTYSLGQNYPNPFNLSTTINYAVPQNGSVTLRVYDINGRFVRTLVEGKVTAGYHQVVWDGHNESGNVVGAGIYFVRMNSASFSKTNKMLLLK